MPFFCTEQNILVNIWAAIYDHDETTVGRVKPKFGLFNLQLYLDYQI